jgi:hypothetical protein
VGAVLAATVTSPSIFLWVRLRMLTNCEKSFYIGILHRTLVINSCYFLGGNINEYVYFFAGNGMVDTKDFSLPSTASEAEGLAVNFAPRRERFTFRKEHLEVLEMYFKKNQYPSLEERLEVALKCNNIMIAACKVLSFIISSLLYRRGEKITKTFVLLERLWWVSVLY